MRSPTLIGDEVVEMGQPREKCLLIATGMMNFLHGERLRSMALWAWSNRALVAGICGSARTAYHPIEALSAGLSRDQPIEPAGVSGLFPIPAELSSVDACERAEIILQAALDPAI